MATAGDSARVICLWTVPRACSTVFERAMMNRPDVAQTFHEPRGIPYYYGPPEERGSSRYENSPVRESQSEVTASIIAAKEAAPPGSYVFIKDMAYYLCGPSGKVDPALLKEALDVIDIHTFLIRNPNKQVQSLHKMSTVKEDEVGWSKFIPAEVGYEELGLVYNTLKADQKGTVVVDADDILKSPRAVLLEYCSRAGIPFKEEMLSWEANEERIIKKFAEWGGWHDSAISSTGWERKHTTAKELPSQGAANQIQEKKSSEDKEVDDLIARCAAAAMAFYEPMFNERVTEL